MIRRILACALVSSLVSFPAAAQGLRGSVAKAAHTEAARQESAESAPPAGRIPPRYLWTGLGLIMGGAQLFWMAEFADCGRGASTCRDQRRAVRVVAAGSAFTGVALLAVGSQRREADGLTVAPRRLVVRRSIRF